MTDSPIRRLIEQSSLGTPDARAARDSVSDETAQRIVARAAQLAADDVWEARLQAKQCRPYFCPTSGDTECCPDHSGWDVCCAKPHLHRPLPREGEPVRPPSLSARMLRVACRVGLHFTSWDHQWDGYRCACGRNRLGAEHIRWD
ncbi:hypothetical protein [Verrucosispora sp. NA02020]|uniref:hypothetical protein n=1 Tax=Verrucosispora sp. NA02020 TaxID=2742132 RepID=UPI00159036E9|nr:hypothetical protein [Verrucosispora sp. NA02020]QKW15465.1 hypothetical protein HUT12_23635 [Verrucosispora sp. NA02020]